MADGPPIRVCLLSSDTGLAGAIARALGPGFEARQKNTLESGETVEQYDVVLLDLRTTSSGGDPARWFRAMDEIQQTHARPPIIVLRDEDDGGLNTQIMQHGAYDTLTNPPNVMELRLTLQRAHRMRSAEKELETLRGGMTREAGRMHNILGGAPAMQELFALVEKIAPCDVSVLITGETGTGKELLAQAIHRMSMRAAGSLVTFSCANLPETLVEAELFGHEKGAFTGAVMSRRGRLEMADQGTLFLDEVGDLSLGLQPKLLRVLQQRSFERLGSNTTIKVNVRLICATNRNLDEMVKQGQFRDDLYYRLNVIRMHLPPLRERREDIALLANHFLQLWAHEFHKKVKRFSQSALHALEEFGWPGNVRELENAVQRAVVLCEGQTIDLCHLPSALHGALRSATFQGSYEEEVREFKRRLLLRTLRECGWRKTESARNLGVARGYLHRLINQLGIRQPEERQHEERSPAVDLLPGIPPSKQIH